MSTVMDEASELAGRSAETEPIDADTITAVDADTETDVASDALGGADGGDDAEVKPTGGRRGIPSMGMLLGGLAAFMGMLPGLGPLSDNSTFTHLATGRLILAERSVPTADPYSWTAHGDPWVVQSWLASIIYAGAEELGGFAGIRLVNGLLCGLLAAGVWLLTSRSPSLLVRLGLTGAAIVVGAEMLAARPLLFGMIGIVAVYLAADGRIDPRWLVPVGWIWVNTHGSFPFAFVLLGALALGHRLDEGSWGREVKVGLWAAAGVALGALNPVGIKILLFPLSAGSRAEVFSTMVEWQPPDYQMWAQYAVLALMMLGVVFLVREPRWRDALPLAVFGALAMTAARNQLPLLLVLMPILAGSAPRFGPTVDGPRRSVYRPAGVALVAMAAVFVMAVLGQPDVELDAYPEDAMVWMEENGHWGPESRVVAPDYVGNFRGLQAGRDARVFIDDRVDMYPDEVVFGARTLIQGRADWPEVLEEIEPTAILWKDDTPLSTSLNRDPAWRVIHHDTDSEWSVFVPADR